MKKWLRPSSIAIASILLVMAIVIWFFQNYEYVTTIVYTGYSGEAKHNNLLAVQRFLRNQQVTVEVVNSSHVLKTQLQKNDVVLVHPRVFDVPKADIDFLLQWVKSGGYLILPVGNTDMAESYKSLLEAVQTEFLENAVKKKQKIFESVALTFKDTQYSVLVDTRYHLKTIKTPRLRLESPHGDHTLLHQYGNGYIAVITNLTLIGNSQIGQGDHAAFFWRLLNFPRATTKLYFFEILGSPPALWEALLKYAWMILVSSGVCLFLWLWIASRRFGRCFPEPSLARRRLLEHIEASAYYLWRHQQSDILLQQTRQAVLQRIEQIHPDWLHRDTAQLYAKLAKIAVVSPADITLALQTDALDSTADFTLAIQTLSKIRKAL
ncbi:hypothetical protein BegalDRAFT_0538 [Beggiatoa alba B18LD]|uniref:DUF4350 domain-containing protein n=1 Tax=Beggiatoa alba B18LD TaxID=395493 RepID=I3CCW3_9GAMM|nr:DUF4350 domain-containing protein [Beggiatoa alba]EIJ41456.1 hypothetical protein BegalDRAFT_0538 [Beggiatoa alba B18LD]